VGQESPGLAPLFRVGQSMHHVIFSTCDASLYFQPAIAEVHVPVSDAVPIALDYLRRLWIETKPSVPLPQCLVAMINLNSPQLVEAVRIWTGWGITATPSRDDARVRRHFGDAAASTILPLLKSLEDDFYSSDARLVASSLQEMEKLSSRHFKQKYPDVADEIVKAFARCYTFDFK